MDAIRSGTLVKGNVYQVVYADNDEVTLLFFDKKAPGRNSHWTLSPHALIPLNRNNKSITGKLVSFSSVKSRKTSL